MTHSFQGETAPLLNTLEESHLLISIMHSSVVCTPKCQDILLTFLTHTEPTVDQHTQIPFCRVILKPLKLPISTCAQNYCFPGEELSIYLC